MKRLACEVCFKRAADRGGVCDVCHGCANDACQRTVHNVALTDEWAKRFIREVGEKNQ